MAKNQTNLESSIKANTANVSDWTIVKTNIDGVGVAPMPKRKNEEERRIAVILNPVDERGKATMRKGVFITSLTKFKQLSALFSHEKMNDLVKAVASLNGDIVTDNDGSEAVIEL